MRHDVMFSSFGELRCVFDSRSSYYRAFVLVDDGIVDFYRSLVPKSTKLNKQRFPPHITVIKEPRLADPRTFHEMNGRTIKFFYDYEIQSGEQYWWLNAMSFELVVLRLMLGLSPRSEYTRPPDGTDCFHITIGNLK
jgi:hypothetical protein